MNIQQLRYLDEIAKQGLNISNAADALNTSQPGVSKQIRLLEDELQADILIRRRNRIIAFTEQGEKILEIARRILWELDNIRRVGDDISADTGRPLVIATTHMHARYGLLSTIKAFKDSFPDVTVSIKQGNPTHVAELVARGQADLGLSTIPTTPKDELIGLPCFRISRCILLPPKHALLRKPDITLQDLAEFPMIDVDSDYIDGLSVMASFRNHQIEPQIVVSAADVDVIKAFVEADMGIAVLPSLAFDARIDKKLRSLSGTHLFDPAVSYVWLHRHSYLRRHVASFIRMLSPVWTADHIESVLNGSAPPDDSLAILPR